MELNLKGRTVLVTGASKGIGRAVAEGFAAEGCDLHLAARSADLLGEAKAALSAAHGASVTVHALDLAAPGAAAGLAAECGDIDILVNNAGAIPAGDLADIDEATWRAAWDLKVFGYINLSRAIYARFKEKGGGVIVNVIGLAGAVPRARYIAGSAGNAGLAGFTRALGGGAPDDNIRVVGIHPGVIATDRMIRVMVPRAEKELGDAERWPELLAHLPFGRAGKPEEVADLAVFLASDRASYISGVVVPIDAGANARDFAY